MQAKSLNLGLFQLSMSLSLFNSELYVVEHVTGSGFYKYLLDLDSSISENHKICYSIVKVKSSRELLM